jgi:large subunit ribosomal protein L30
MKVTLVKSLIGVKENQCATVRALGLCKKNQSRELPDNPAVRGMIRQVAYLLKVE